jgi:hypothetical protein
MSPKTTTGRTQQKKIRELEVSDMDDDADDPMSTALYGRASTGKTTLSSTWPKPILYCDVMDRGSKSIRDVKKMKKRRIEAFEDFEETYWWLIQNPKAYATVVVDTVTQLQRLLVEEHHARKRTSKGSKSAGDWGSMTKRDWGDVAAVMKEWIINYRDLVDIGMEVVFIAQDRTFNLSDEDDDTDIDESLAPEIGPALSPAVAKLLNASVDVIGNTFIRERTIKANPAKKIKARKEIEYCLRIGPNPLYITKVRKPRSIEAPAVIVDPDYDSIMAIIEGE